MHAPNHTDILFVSDQRRTLLVQQNTFVRCHQWLSLVNLSCGDADANAGHVATRRIRWVTFAGIMGWECDPFFVPLGEIPTNVFIDIYTHKVFDV